MNQIIIWFIHILRNMVDFMLCILLTLIEINDCKKVVMDLLLDATDLLAPSNLMEALEYKFTIQFRAVCSWTAQAMATNGVNPGATFEVRILVIKISEI